MRSAPLTSDFADGQWTLLRLFARADFDPLTGLTMGLMMAGGLVSGAGSIIGGQAQQAEANYQAQQLEQQAPSEIAAAQRQAQDQKLKSELAVSQARAGAAFGGVTASEGSALTNQENLAGRGEYNALMDLWQGQNRATGDINAAQAARYGGQVAAIGGDLAGAGSIVGGLTNAGKAYTAFNYATPRASVLPNIG